MAADAILKNRKIVISPPRFDRFRPNLARQRISTLLSRPTIKNVTFQKFKMAAAAILKKNGKSPYLVRGLTDFDQIWHGDALRPSCTVRPLKIWNLENPRWRRPPFWKNRKIAISRPPLGRFRRNLTRWRSFAIALMQTEIPVTSEKSNLKGK